MPLGCRNIEPVCLGAHSIDPDEDESSVSLTVANNTIVGALLQLSSLVRHADDIFCDISEECQLVFERTDKLCKKIAHITKTVIQLDAKRVQIPEGDLKKFSAVSEHHRARHGYDAHLFLATNRTQCIHDQYNLCQPNPSHVIRSADLYRKDGLSGSKMFKCWPVTYNDQAVKTPDLSLPRRVQRVRSFERKYKKLRERPKTIHGWDDFKLEDLKNEEEKEKDKYLAKTVNPVVVSIDTSGSNFERMQSLRFSGRRYQNKEEREKKKRRRRTVTGVPESIVHEIEKFDRQKRHQGGGPRKTPRSYSFDDLDAEYDIERDEGIVKYLDEIDGKMEERLGDEKAQKLMKFFPCRRSRSLPRCMKMASVARSLSVERKSRSTREIDRDLNATYGSSSLSLASAVSSASSRLSRSTKRAIGTKLKSLVSNAKDIPRQRPKSLDIDTFLDNNNKGNSIKSQERSKSTYSLERNKEARSVPDSLLHKEFSERSSSTVGPGSYYNFESSTLPRAQQKKYDFPWESLPKDWTTSVKLREISKRRSKEDRQSSSGNWSQSGTSSNRHSLDSDLRSEGVKFNSQYSLGKDSGRDSLTLEEENDGATDTTSTAGYAADGTSTIVGSNDSISIGNPKTDFTQLETEQWLQSLAARAAAREEVILADGSASLSRLTRKNIIALDLMLTQDTIQKKGDEESSVYSVDQEGFYTSFHNDSGLRKSTNTLVDEEQCSPTKDSNSVCSVDSVIYRPHHSDDKFANLRKGGNQAKVLSKVTPPLPPVRTTSKNINGDNQGSPVHPELQSFSSQDSSVSESDTEAVFSRVQDKTVLSGTGYPSLVALSTSDDESSPGSLNSFGLDNKGTRKGDNYIFDETECESRDTQFKLYSKFSPSNQDIGNSLASSKSESNFLQYVNKSSDKLSILHEKEATSAEAKAVSYQSWPRTHKSSTPSGILKTPEKQFDNRPHKTLNFAPMVNLFKHGAQNSVQMPLPSPTNSSSSESNVNTFGVFNGISFSAQPDQKYQLTVPVHGNSNSKLKSKVGSPEILPVKYQPVITVTPRSRSGDRKGTDKVRPAKKNQIPDKSPIYASSNVNPKAQSTPHNSSASQRNTSRSQSLYAVSPVVASRDTKRQISNTSSNSSNSEYIDMQSVGSLQSAESISSLGSVEGLSFADQSAYMSMSSPCSSPNLSNMDFSMSSTPSGSVNSLTDLRKTPTNELENDTYRINTNLHMNRAYAQQNGPSSNGFDKPSSQPYNSSRRGSANSHQVSSANSSVNNFRSTNSRNTSLNSDNHSMNSSSSSSDNDLTRVTQLSMNSSNGSASGSRASPNQRQPGRESRQDTRHEPSYRSHNTSNRRSLPSDVTAVNVNMYTQKVPLNDTKSKTYTSKTPPSQQMSSSKSFPSGFNNAVGPQKVAGPRNRSSPSAPPPTNKDGFSSRSDSYRVAMDVCATNNRNASNRVAMHPSKSYPFLPPTTKSGPYRVAMDMNPKASLNNSYNSDNDDVMSRADSYRIAVRNTNGIVPQDMANRNTSYRVAVDDDAPSMMTLKLDAMNLDSKKKSNSGRDVRRMGITDVDQAKDISVSKPMSNGKVSKSQLQQSTSSTRICKVTKQDIDPIQVVQTVDNNNDTKKSQKNNQNRSSTYIQFDPIFEDVDFGSPADALQIMATKAESQDLSFKDYSASLSSASKVKYGKISGGLRDANSNDIKSAKRGKPAHVNSGVEIEDNWRFSQV